MVQRGWRSAALALLLLWQPGSGYPLRGLDESLAATGMGLAPGKQGYRGVAFDALGLGGDGGGEEETEQEEAQPTRGVSLATMGLGGGGGVGEGAEEEESQPNRAVSLSSLGLGGGGGFGGGQENVRVNQPEEPSSPEEPRAQSANDEMMGESQEVHRGDAPEKAEADVVEFVLSLALNASSSEPIPRGDIEEWVCYLDGLVAEKLAFTSSRSHVVVLVAHDDAFDPAASTLKLELVSSNDPDTLLEDLESTLDANAINLWFQKDLPKRNALYGSEVVDWERSLREATIASDPKDTFSTSDCGTARVSMMYGFFEDFAVVDPQDEQARTKYEADVQNLMCSTGDYLLTLYGEIEKGMDLIVTVDRVEWEVDLTAVNPLTVHFDILAKERGTGRRLPPVSMLEWMARSDMQYYIQEAVWTALPYQESIFSNVNGVFFDAKVRGLDKTPPAQTMSTLDCVEGRYDPEYEDTRDPSILDVTKWVLHFGFEDGFEVVEPTHEEIEALFCQTFFYYKDMLEPSADTPVVYTNLSMVGWETTFSPEEPMPFIMYLDAEAWMPRGIDYTKVNARVLEGKMKQTFNINTYITDYVWNSEPKKENVMFHTSNVEVEAGVRERHASLQFNLNSTTCYRVTEAPSLEPTGVPTNMPSLAPTTEATTGPSGGNETESDDSGGLGDGNSTSLEEGDEGDNEDDNSTSLEEGDGEDSGDGNSTGLGDMSEDSEEDSDSGNSGGLGGGMGGGLGGGMGGGLGGIGGSFGGIGGGFGGGGLGGNSNGGVNNGPQSLGSGSGSSGFADLGGGSLGNRPPESEEAEEEGVEEEDMDRDSETGGGVGGGIGGGIGGGYGGGGSSIGSGIGSSIGGNSVPSTGNSQPASSGPEKSTVAVDTSFVAIHLPSIPVSDGSDHVNDALADMLQNMIANKPRPGMRPPQRRRLEVTSELDKDSIQTGNASNVDCAEYYDVEQYGNDMACSHVDVQYDVIVTGAESDEDLDAVRADYKNMTDEGIESGELQESLDKVAPDSGLLLVPDQEQDEPVEDRAGTDPPAAAEAPPARDPSASTDSPAAFPEETVFHVPEPPGAEFPQTTQTYAPKPQEDSKDDGSDNPPLWAMILAMLILFCLGIATGMNVHRCRSQRERRQSRIDTDARLLT